jgi:hypothetical protein
MLDTATTIAGVIQSGMASIYLPIQLAGVSAFSLVDAEIQ